MKQTSCRRKKARGGILGIEARLNCMALDGNIGLRQRQGLTTCDAQLPLHQIKSGDRLRHRMLNLQPGIHFHEPYTVGAEPVRGVGDEFNRTGPLIADSLTRPDRGGA